MLNPRVFSYFGYHPCICHHKGPPSPPTHGRTEFLYSNVRKSLIPSCYWVGKCVRISIQFKKWCPTVQNLIRRAGRCRVLFFFPTKTDNSFPFVRSKTTRLSCCGIINFLRVNFYGKFWVSFSFEATLPPARKCYFKWNPVQMWGLH